MDYPAKSNNQCSDSYSSLYAHQILQVDEYVNDDIGILKDATKTHFLFRSLHSSPENLATPSSKTRWQATSDPQGNSTPARGE